jgi:hypothetical protein
MLIYVNRMEVEECALTDVSVNVTDVYTYNFFLKMTDVSVDGTDMYGDRYSTIQKIIFCKT